MTCPGRNIRAEVTSLRHERAAVLLTAVARLFVRALRRGSVAALLERAPEVRARVRVAAAARLLEELLRAGVVLLDAVALSVRGAEVAARARVARVASDLEELRCLREVPLHREEDAEPRASELRAAVARLSIERARRAFVLR